MNRLKIKVPDTLIILISLVAINTKLVIRVRGYINLFCMAMTLPRSLCPRLWKVLLAEKKMMIIRRTGGNFRRALASKGLGCLKSYKKSDQLSFLKALKQNIKVQSLNWET
jgi:hypothetical protein